MTVDSSAQRTLRIAVVPDSFKGSASAREAADAIAEGARSGLAGFPRPVQIDTLPVADGGEGTLDAFLDAWNVTPTSTQATDALGRPVTAKYALSPHGHIAVIEAAQANGLPLVSDQALRPRTASSRGVGEIAAHALDAGVSEIVLCIGGSATTDGGAGLLAALGARFLDADGSPLAEGGEALNTLTSIDLDDLHPKAREVTWRIACDVTNPLLGERGAAAVFGPQKGATTQDVDVLDRGLARLADVLEKSTGTDVREEPGAGAAGGIPAVMTALLGAELVAGASVVFETLDADTLLREADLVITGEGRFDAQSFDGKVVDAVRRRTPPWTPVVVIAGAVDVDVERMAEAHITAALSIASGPASLDDLSGSAIHAIERTARTVMQLIASGTRLTQPLKDATP